MGGAIKFSQNSIVFILNSTFIGNFAEDGSAIYSMDQLNIVNIVNCSFFNNSSPNSMIDIFNADMKLINCTIFNNFNPSISLLESYILISKLNFTDNFCDKIDFGCFINGQETTIFLTDTKVNKTFNPQNLYINIMIQDSRMYFNNSLSLNCFGTIIGSCLYSKNSNVSINNIKFENFTQNSFYAEFSKIFIVSTVFTNMHNQNSPTFMCISCTGVHVKSSVFQSSIGSSRGGAIFFQFTRKSIIYETKFLNNSASDAGAIYALNSDVFIIFSEFNSNQALLGSGGAILFDNYPNFKCSFLVEHSNFSLNSAKKDGGAIKYTNNIPLLKYDYFFDNKAGFGQNVSSYPIRMAFKIYTINDSGEN